MKLKYAVKNRHDDELEEHIIENDEDLEETMKLSLPGIYRTATLHGG